MPQRRLYARVIFRVGYSGLLCPTPRSMAFSVRMCFFPLLLDFLSLYCAGIKVRPTAQGLHGVRHNIIFMNAFLPQQ